MAFSLSLDRYSNSSCMRCELDLYNHPSSDHSRGLFYPLTWIVWCRSTSLWRCCLPSIVFASSISLGFYWSGVVYRWLQQLGLGLKIFQQRHLPYSVEVVQSIVHHYISRRCSSHMVRDAGIGCSGILITIATQALCT